MKDKGYLWKRNSVVTSVAFSVLLTCQKGSRREKFKLSQCREKNNDYSHQYKKYDPLKNRYGITAWYSENEFDKILNNVH